MKYSKEDAKVLDCLISWLTSANRFIVGVADVAEEISLTNSQLLWAFHHLSEEFPRTINFKMVTRDTYQFIGKTYEIEKLAVEGGFTAVYDKDASEKQQEELKRQLEINSLKLQIESLQHELQDVKGAKRRSLIALIVAIIAVLLQFAQMIFSLQ